MTPTHALCYVLPCVDVPPCVSLPESDPPNPSKPSNPFLPAIWRYCLPGLSAPELASDDDPDPDPVPVNPFDPKSA